MHDWEKICNELKKKHSHSDCHMHSSSLWAGYKHTSMHESVSDQLNSGRAKVIEENRENLISICQVTVLCARQDIALRGHCEHDQSSNKENFREILDLVSSKHSSLKQHMQGPQNEKNATQNDLLHDVAKVMTEVIIDEVKGLSSLQL